MNYSVYDSLLDSVVAIDAQGVIHYRNEMFASLCDLPLRKVREGSSLAEIVTFKGDLSLAPAEATGYREVDYQSASGKTGSVQICIQPDPNSTDRRWLLYMRDVSLERQLHLKYRSELAQKTEAHELLAQYAKGLEKMVADRTLQLSEINRLLTAILESLGQGFLVFDRNGICQDVYSKACRTVLECTPAKLHISKVLKIPESERNSFEMWITALFEEAIPFQDLIPLGPSSFTHSQKKVITLEFQPLRSDLGKPEGVVLIATDHTEEHRAKSDAERERAYVQRILKLLKYRQPFRLFLADARKILDELLALSRLNGTELQKVKPSVMNRLHTLKGGAASFFMNTVSSLAHDTESLISSPDFSNKSASEFGKNIEQINRELSEFLTAHAIAIGSLESETVELPQKSLLSLAHDLKRHSGTDEIQKRILDWINKTTAAQAFSHYEETIRDLASRQGKPISQFIFEGADIQIPSTLANILGPTLIHAFRNSVDHGLKSSGGTLALRCRTDKQHIEILIEDDGRGISAADLRTKLSQQKPKMDFSKVSDDEILQYVLEDGVSTQENVTELSGRGVGMSAIAEAVRKLHGTIRIESKEDLGTRVVIKIPI